MTVKRRSIRFRGVKDEDIAVSILIDPSEEEDDFKNDSDTKSVLSSIDGLIGHRTPQDAYDWLCDLESKIADRIEKLIENPDVKG